MKRKPIIPQLVRKSNRLRALYIISRRKLGKITDEKLIVILCAAVFLLQLFIMVTAIAAPLHASEKQVPAKSAGLQIGDSRLNDTVGQARMKGLQIGQEVPDVTITNIINYKTPTAKISDFKGKLLILDFWATWCSPCVAMIPKTDSLQKAFSGRVQFLPVTYQTQKEVVAFFQRYKTIKDLKLTTATGDTQLAALFPHRNLPHYVWIDGNGVVKAISGHQEVNAENITIMLMGEKPPISRKVDLRIPYDPEKLLLSGSNGGDGSKLLFRSLLTAFTPGLSSGYSIKQENVSIGKRITATNETRLALYQLAFGGGSFYVGRNRVLLELQDTSKWISDKSGMEYLNWLSEGNAYCYEIQMPKGMAALTHSYIQQDLKRLFPQYDANIEKRLRKCLVLVRTSRQMKFAATDGPAVSRFDPFGFTLKNRHLNILIGQLNVIYFQKSPMPVIDGTGYTGRVNLEITAQLGDVDAMNRELAKYDLRLVEKEREIDMVVIRDRNLSSKPKNAK